MKDARRTPRRTVVRSLLAAPAAFALILFSRPPLTASSAEVGARPTDSQGAGRAILDDLGRSFPLPDRPPQRIVSLAPNVTEILFALGLGSRVAGVTRFCDFPPEAASKPKVGGLVDPNVEIVRSLDPDLVIAFRGNPLRSVERIGRLGLPVFVLDLGRTLDGLPPLVRRIGLITGSAERAEALAAELERRVKAVDEAVGPALRRPRVFVLLSGQGLWTCGRGSFLDDLIRRAGGENVASAAPKKWVLYRREQVLKDDPDIVILLAKSPAAFASSLEWLKHKSRLDGLAAVRAGRVHELDEDAASRFGPRLVDVLERLAVLLHSERSEDRS